LSKYFINVTLILMLGFSGLGSLLFTFSPFSILPRLVARCLSNLSWKKTMKTQKNGLIAWSTR